MRTLRARRGSAFVLALMVLAVLTVIGLSVSLITETEMSIGETEKIQNEQFFASEAGLTAALSGLLVTNNTAPVNIVIPSQTMDRSRSNLQAGVDVQTSGFNWLTEGPLPYTKIESYVGTYYYTRALTRRTAWDKSEPVPTCDQINDVALGTNLTAMGFYYAPTQPPSSETIWAGHEAANLDSAGQICGGVAGQKIFDFINFD